METKQESYFEEFEYLAGIPASTPANIILACWPRMRISLF